MRFSSKITLYFIESQNVLVALLCLVWVALFCLFIQVVVATQLFISISFFLLLLSKKEGSTEEIKAESEKKQNAKH